MALKQFTIGEKLLASDLNSMVDAIQVTETTWEELKNLRDNSQLIPGATYRITDYTCTTVQEGTRSAGHVFDIIVTADDVNILNENAHAIQNKEEIIFEYPTMEVDGTSYYLWTKYEGGAKTNYQILTSELDIDCSLDKPYEPDAWLNYEYVVTTRDDKFVYLENNNGVYRLYKTNVQDYPDEVDRSEYFECSNKSYFANSDLSAWELKYCLDNDTTRFAWADSTNGRGVVYYMKDEFNNECPYDFKNIQFELVKLYSITWKSGVSSNLISSYNEQFVGHYVGDWFTVNQAGTANLAAGNIAYTYTFSGALYIDGTVEGSVVGRFGNNTIEPYYDDSDNGNGTYAMLLNHIVIMDDDGNDTDNMISNKFGGNCRNIFVYGYSFNNNTFGNNCYCNTFGNGCGSNTFGNNCYCNTFGNGCYSNTFGNDCYYNTFGNYFRSNTFRNYCRSNTFGNDCCYITFGNSCRYNTFGNNCYSNTFVNDYIQYSTFFDGVNNLNVSITTGSNNYLQYMQVLNGTKGTSSSKLQITGDTYVTAGRAYTTTIGKNSSGTLTSKAPMDA